jgi:YD repeat-containing protein
LPSNNPYIPDFVASQIPVESSVQYYSWGNTSVATQTVNKTWYDQYDLKAQQTILQDVSPSQSSQVTYCYVPSDQNYPCLPSSTLAQLAERDDYDFGATNPSRKTITTYASFPTTPIGGVMKDRAAAVITTDGSGNRYSEIDYTYDAYAGGIGSASATNHDDANFPTTYTARGNVTTKTQKCFVGSTTCTNSITTYSYDDTGQVSSMTDPCGNGTCSDMPTGSSHTTHYYYTDNYTTLSGGSNVKYTPSTNTNTYLTQITNSKGQIDTFSYDYYGGQLTAFRNQNDINAGRPGTTYIYNDALLRVTEGTHPDGGQTTYSYNDSVPSATRTTVIDNTVSPTWATSTTSVMDGLGRTIHLELTTDPQGADSTDTTYDGFGRVWKKSNPHRSSTSPTDGIATYIYDSLGRVCLTVPQDIVAVPTTCPTSPPLGDVFTSYTGNCTTVTDEAGKARKSCVD